VFKSLAHRRFKPLDIALAVFLAGCVPTILMALVAYSILRGAVESKITVDRHTLVQSLTRVVSAELMRTAEVMEYYQALPIAQRMVLRQPGDQSVEAWLAEAYYSHPRIDGMFTTDGAGKLISALPSGVESVGQDFSSAEWLEGARLASGASISAVYPRLPDHRLCTAIVAAIRTKSGEIPGYVGATVLVERIGKRLAALKFGDQSVVEVLDQNGVPLFDENLQPNNGERTADAELLKAIRSNSNGYFQLRSNLVSFDKIEGTDWTAILQQPVAVAYAPVHEFVSRTGILAAWLVVLSAVAAWLVGTFYRKQLVSDERIASETFLKDTILANMPVGIALVAPETKNFLHANERFFQIARDFGSAPANRDRAQLRLGDVRLGIERAFDKVLSEGVPFEAREQKVTGPDGKIYFLTINLLRLRDAAKHTHGILLLVEDNTADITIRKELIAANNAKDEFLALLSHELRNPLSPVITMVHELEKSADGDEKFRAPLEIIRRNVELEARLIDDLLDITRIAHGKLQLTPEIINAHRAIGRALEICQRDIESKHLEVALDLKAPEHHIKADPARFQQVLWNLIKNAVKFTETGLITIRSRNTDQRKLLIEVIDSGIGIEPDRLSKIFNAFEQGESSITRRFGGLGLGLAISKAMIEASGGTLTASSAGKGTGSVFTVELDTVDAATTADEQSKTPTLAGVTLQHKILLVDDHEDTCIGMKMLLERRGYRVRTANTVQGALNLAGQEKFDLLISDLGLPDGTGFDLMEKLRERGSEIRGIALSGFGMESDIEHSRAAGFSEHLIKPVNLERLDIILKQAFAGDGLV
jgi:signal transduction histidine kinase